LMSGGEAYEAMQRRTVDGSETTLASVIDRKYYEVAKYLTVYMNYPSYHVWIVNRKWWNDLSQDKREILRQAALAAQEWDRKELEGVEADYVKKLQTMMTTHVQTEAEAAEWAEILGPITDKWLKSTGEEGKKLLALIKETVNEQKAQKKK